MERREEYEPIIVDLQKSTLVKQPHHYVPIVLLSVGVLVAIVALAAFYFQKPTPVKPPIQLTTTVPDPTATIAVEPTPVPAEQTPEPTPVTQPAAIATPVPTGRLNLLSSPANAEVLIGGKMVGHTPLMNFALEPGTYPVKFAYQGKIFQYQITITAGETSELTHRFEGFAALDIKTTSSGSDITINGELVGKSPLVKDGLLPGTYKIVASKVGFATAEETVTLAAGEYRELLITIKRLDLAVPETTPRPSRPLHPSERLQQTTP